MAPTTAWSPQDAPPVTDIVDQVGDRGAQDAVGGPATRGDHGVNQVWGWVATAFGLLLLLITFGIATSSRRSLPAPPPTSDAFQIPHDLITTGECLRGNLQIGTGKPFPWYVTVVPCAEPHVAEVIFEGPVWSAGAAYPGVDSVTQRADYRCGTAYAEYVDSQYFSAFTRWDVAPLYKSDWSTQEPDYITCLAYRPRIPGDSAEGAVPVDYSIRRRKLALAS
jgi:hypothetical protein